MRSTERNKIERQMFTQKREVWIVVITTQRKNSNSSTVEKKERETNTVEQQVRQYSVKGGMTEKSDCYTRNHTGWSDRSKVIEWDTEHSGKPEDEGQIRNR